MLEIEKLLKVPEVTIDNSFNIDVNRLNELSDYIRSIGQNVFISLGSIGPFLPIRTASTAAINCTWPSKQSAPLPWLACKI